MPTYNTYITYTADGVTQDFPIPFSYDSESEVLVYVNSSLSVTHYFPSPGLISFPSPPDSGVEVLILRDTPVDTPAVVWGSETVLGKDVNTLANQIVKKLQEVTSYTADVVPVISTLENMEPLVASAQAAAATATTKALEASTSASDAYNDATAAAASAAEAAASAADAAVSAGDAAAEAEAAESARAAAGVYAGSASSSASSAAASATSAALSATDADGSASAAAGSASSASSSATSAASSASSASTSASNASSSASAAATSASNASTSASNASTSASSAATSASSAATSATNADGSANAAAGSANTASSAATSAASARVAAEAARDSALAAYDNFDDRYLGAKTSDPTVDNDGNALVAGALYFNTSTTAMRIYTGSAWYPAYVSGTGYLAAANNLSDLASASTARTNLGLGSMATQNASGVNITGGTATLSTLNTTGNVGVGTSSPGSALEVAGTITIKESGKAFNLLVSSPSTAYSGYLATYNSSGTRIGYSGYWDGSTLTGAWTDGATPLMFGTNGSERIRVDSSGNVGVGTASPLATLHVAGSSLLGALNSQAVVTSSNGGGMFVTWNFTGGSAETNLWNIYDNAGVSFVMRQKTGTSTYKDVYSAGTSNHIWYTNGSERMRIDSSGNVGVGTGAPASRLHVNSNGGQLFLDNASGGQYTQINWLNGSVTKANAYWDNTYSNFYLGTDVYAPFLLKTNGTERIVISASGNVGIGTSSPSALLDVQGSSPYARVKATGGSYALLDIDAPASNQPILRFLANGVEQARILSPANESASQLVFTTGSGTTERMRINASGNVGIGTSSPATQLELTGTITARTNTSCAYSQFVHGSASNSSGYLATFTAAGTRIGFTGWYQGTAYYAAHTDGATPILLNTNGTERMRIDSSGNVGIGTGSPGCLLDVNGKISFTSIASGAKTALNYVTPQMYGAAGNGTTDDTSALSSALNSGYPVLLFGSYRITSTITVNLTSSVRGLTVFGAGSHLGRIILDFPNASTSHGLVVTIADMPSPWSNTAEAVNMRDFTFVPNGYGQGDVLQIIGQVASGSTMPSFDLHNVNIIPASTSVGWVGGFYFYDCRCSAMSNCNLMGGYGAFAGYGIVWTGSAASAPVHFYIRNCGISHYHVGIALIGSSSATAASDWQGAVVDGCIVIGVNHGIYCTAGPNMFADDIKIVNCHFNFVVTGINNNGVTALKVMNNSFLAVSGSGTVICISNYIGNGKADFGCIIGNNMDMRSSGGSARYAYYGISSASNSYANIHSNTSIGANSGFIYPGGYLTTSDSSI